MRDSIIAFCQAAGSDPLLVQGAGGNVSWKEGDTLWIKASGTWLADAGKKDIFVQVELGRLQMGLAQDDYEVMPKAAGASSLKPSIETLLHALMPHRVVVHLHAVEILAHLVRESAENTFNEVLDGLVRWIIIPYQKPGAPLARAVAEALKCSPGSDVLFLMNHGVVIGGNSIEEVERILRGLISALKNEPYGSVEPKVPLAPLLVDGVLQYVPLADAEIQRLALDKSLFSRLSASQWALYPDHVVFLGPRAACYGSIASLITQVRQQNGSPDLVFVEGIGVYAKPSFSLARLVQLRCYYDVLVRQPEQSAVSALSDEQIAELLDWDAEKYRMRMAK